MGIQFPEIRKFSENSHACNTHTLHNYPDYSAAGKYCPGITLSTGDSLAAAVTKLPHILSQLVVCTLVIIGRERGRK